jgi:hypothetical protein
MAYRWALNHPPGKRSLIPSPVGLPIISVHSVRRAPCVLDRDTHMWIIIPVSAPGEKITFTAFFEVDVISDPFQDLLTKYLESRTSPPESAALKPHPGSFIQAENAIKDVGLLFI